MLHQDSNLLPRKEQVIARVLYKNGIVIWDGIPEQIIHELKAHGYRIKRRKKHAKN